MNGHQAITHITRPQEMSDKMRNKLAKRNRRYESFQVFFGKLAPRTPSTWMIESKIVCILVDKGWLGLLSSWGKHCLLHSPISHLLTREMLSSQGNDAQPLKLFHSSFFLPLSGEFIKVADEDDRMDEFGKIPPVWISVVDAPAPRRWLPGHRSSPSALASGSFPLSVGQLLHGAPSPPPPQPSSALPPTAGRPASSAPPGPSHSATRLALLSLARWFLVQLAFFLIPHRVLWLDAVGQVINA